MSAPKILLTGATGYIGGSVLTTLLASENPLIKAAQITALVRKQEQVDLLKEKGIDSTLFSGLDDVSSVRDIASQYDVVIHTASSFDTPAAKALIAGLEDRKKKTGQQTSLIHTSGTSSLGDQPIRGTFAEKRVFSDKDDIYTYERYREDLEAYPQRTTDLVVFEKGEAAGVKTYIVTAPTIYGIGNGLFNRTSIQIDAVIRAAKLDGYAVRVGSGSEEWDHVHIADLVKLYETILARLLAGDDLPSNKNGVYFAETGHHSWKELSDRVAKDGKALGYLQSDVVREVGLKDGSAKLHVPELVVELGFASRSRTQAEKSREIGWAPTKTRQDFEESFHEEWKFLAKAAKWSV
ncbi:unnamed protein product [Clonostachys byssicola]|uniref:NAD-dependent epimerase/dehydratase domain-containing protein n=1 Tax=Clonostachys byssicola TaxID=160290 RepID=A0A9N9V0V8_9HYPO|nr:unnamed protein product [Clonostachys byssicola]